MGKVVKRKVAIIPARGGSKRLPRKNILPINGCPMIGYPIRVAIECGIFDDVLVSTEDCEIADISESFGATVIHRPEVLAQDRSTVAQVCEDVLLRPEYQDVEMFCCIYATAIFLTPEDLAKSYSQLIKEKSVDFVMGVSEYNYHPVQALVEVNGCLRSMWPEFNRMQSQFYPYLVVSNGTLTWARKKAFLEEKTFYGERLKGYKVDPSSAVDIDTKEDFEIARKKAKGLL